MPSSTARRYAVMSVCMTVLCALFLFPVFWVVISSFKGRSELFMWPISFLPQSPTLENYVLAFEKGNFPLYFANSVFVAITATLLTLVISLMAGYAFAKYRFRLRGVLFAMVMATMMIPNTVTMVPNYIILRSLGLLDTYTGLILPFLGKAFSVFLMRQSMLGVNDAYLESAFLDGASLYRVFWKIMLPMVTPTLATLTLISFLGSWNSYLWPLIVLTSTDKQTLQVVMGNMKGMYKNNEHVLMAGAVLTILPILAVYLATQRYVDQGISLGGLK